MNLHMEAVDRLIDRLRATYGRDFAARYEGVQPEAVKAIWARELAGFGTRLGSIAWALENLPERAPNAIEFRNLCRRAPEAPAPRIEAPPADPERVRVALATLKPAPAKADGRDWARRILARAADGEKPSFISVQFAREALADRAEVAP